ncbi:MAG: hypothetical protein AAFN11_13615, partial [Chloroflexota bacterium]
RNPPRRHPLFEQVLKNSRRDTFQVTSGFIIWGLLFVSALFVATMIVKWMALLVVGAFLFLNSVYAARWAIRIANTILTEKETRRYDLLASLPTGLLGTSWALSTGAIHRRSSFRWMPYLVLMTVITSLIALCTLVTVTFGLLDQISRTDTMLAAHIDFINTGIIAIPFVIWFYIDHLYSILTAVLVAQVVTVDADYSADGQVMGLLGFMAVQVLIYALTFGIAVVVVPALFSAIGLTGTLPLIFMGILGIVLFIVIREFAVQQLWERLTTALEADAQEKWFVLTPIYEQQAQLILKESEKARARFMDANRSME